MCIAIKALAAEKELKLVYKKDNFERGVGK